jgi:hypothetical protein
LLRTGELASEDEHSDRGDQYPGRPDNTLSQSTLLRFCRGVPFNSPSDHEASLRRVCVDYPPSAQLSAAGPICVTVEALPGVPLKRLGIEQR